MVIEKVTVPPFSVPTVTEGVPVEELGPVNVEEAFVPLGPVEIVPEAVAPLPVGKV